MSDEVRKLDNGSWNARYVGPDGLRYSRTLREVGGDSSGVSAEGGHHRRQAAGASSMLDFQIGAGSSQGVNR